MVLKCIVKWEINFERTKIFPSIMVKYTKIGKTFIIQFAHLKMFKYQKK